MSEFAALCCHEDAIWREQSEEALEGHLRNTMGKIVAKVMETWAAMIVPGNLDVHYVVERSLIPCQLLKFVGGYALGPRRWPYEVLPDKNIGKIMWRVLFQAPRDRDIQLFNEAKKELYT